MVSGREPMPRHYAVQHDADRVGTGHRGAAVQAEHARGQRHNVLAEHDVGNREPGVQPVVNHGLCPAAALRSIAKLEDEQQC